MSVLLDEETVVLEALDFEVPCRKVGDHRAEVSFACRGCGHVEFSCRMHLEQLRGFIAINTACGIKTVHVRCGYRAWSLDELAVVVPF